MLDEKESTILNQQIAYHPDYPTAFFYHQQPISTVWAGFYPAQIFAHPYQFCYNTSITMRRYTT